MLGTTTCALKSMIKIKIMIKKSYLKFNVGRLIFEVLPAISAWELK